MPYEWYNDEWNHYDCEDGADYEWNWDCPRCNKPMCDENWENIYTSFRKHMNEKADCKWYCMMHKSKIPDWVSELDLKQEQPVLSGEPDHTWWIKKRNKGKKSRSTGSRNEYIVPSFS